MKKISNHPVQETHLTSAIIRLAKALEGLNRIPFDPSSAPSFTSDPRDHWSYDKANLFRYQGLERDLITVQDYRLGLHYLCGIEDQKAFFQTNLERFANCLPANHVLLWGARGTGKSALIKAGFMAARGICPQLKLLEIDSEHILDLPQIFYHLRQNPFRFLVFCDDLSFAIDSPAARVLKSALEGGVMGPPDNVLFLATSNRRHLMPRDHGKLQAEDPLLAAETLEETISVSDRFGLWIGFSPMNKETYLQCVKTYATGLGLSSKTLEHRALQWAMQRGGRSGRVAFQFIKDIAGEAGISLPF